MPHPPPVALTIAGSDSGGGAGIQADLKTFHAFGVFGTTAVTAVTAQNTVGVSAVHVVPGAVVQQQIDAVMADLAPAAVKSGMLATAELVSAVAEALSRHDARSYVLDPVMVATSGDRLLAGDAVDRISRLLLPLASLITPNLPEAAILVGGEVQGVTDMRRAARALVDKGAGAALVKGGHLGGDEVIDVFWDGARERTWRRKRVDTLRTHGTGCTLSAAVTAGLALSRPLEEAVGRGLAFVSRAIRNAPDLGAGHGPLNHWVSVDADRPTGIEP